MEKFMRNYSYKRFNRRDTPEYKAWSKAVYKRDGFKCVACGKRCGKWPNAHHLNGWHWFIAGRYEVRNGVTLCTFKEGCHTLFHKEYGNSNNTEHQFDEFLRRHFNKTLKDINLEP